MNDSQSGANSLYREPPPKKEAGIRSLSRRLAVGLTAAVGLVSIITFLTLYLGAIHEVEADLIRRADVYTDYLVGALELPMWNYDNPTIETICRTFLQNELVVGIVIKNTSGLAVRAIGKGRHPDGIDKAGKIYHRGEFLGDVEIDFTKRYVKEAGRRLLSSYATTMLFVLISLGLLTHLFVRKFLKKPIDTLDRIVRPYAIGIYDLPMAKLPYLEFQAFGKTLAKMAETIRLQMGEIQGAEKKYRSIFENAIEGIYQSTPQGRFLSVNPALANIFGYGSPEELLAGVTDIGQQHYVNPQNRARFQKILNEHGFVEGFETEWYRRNGSRICVSINAHAVHDQDGKVLCYEGSVEDITKRKLAEEKLKVSEERLRMTLEATQIGIFDWDVAHDNWYVSPEYYTMLGYAPKEGLGDRKQWLERVHPDDRAHVETSIREVLARDSSADPSRAYGYEARMRHDDGTYRWQHVKGFGVKRAPQGRVTRILGIRMDITERKAAEEALRLLNRELDRRVLERTAQLEATNKEMHAFTYTVSHDLRAPLRHIDGFLELLQKTMGTAMDGKSRHYMNTISEAANKMGLLIDDLLSFSRMGRHTMSFQPVALGTLVRDIIRDLEPDAAGRTIDWHIGDLPAVVGDAAMLRIVLDNLIANALKFTRSREKALIEIGSQPGQNSQTVIFVRDNGVGFDMVYGDKLFGVFQRLHRTEAYEGTGIGLATVRRIIDRHGGRVWAKGKPNQGAAFFFSLPQPFPGN